MTKNKKQPTATEFIKKQASWASFLQEKIDAKIKDREEYLRSIAWEVDEFPDDPVLMDLYDDAMFYSRYFDEMEKQRAFIRGRYLGEGD